MVARHLPNKTLFLCQKFFLPYTEACFCSDQCTSGVTGPEDEDEYDDEGDEEREDK